MDVDPVAFGSEGYFGSVDGSTVGASDAAIEEPALHLRYRVRRCTDLSGTRKGPYCER